MANIKFTQLPNQGAVTDATILPTVASGTNYTVTGANLKTYVNSTTGNVTAGNLNTSGNVTGTYILGNGSLLTGIVSSYGNANVATYLPVNTANIQANFMSAAGNITGAYILGNGSQLTGLPANYGNANVTTLLASFGSNTISTTGTVIAGSLVGAVNGANITGTISTAGNITGGYLFGNISGATGGYGNSNVQAVLQTYSGSMTTGTLSATGNISGNYFVGNGSALTGITASLGGTMTSNIAGAGYSISNVAGVTATGNITAANINGAYFGSGANLTGIPTSIVAGSGISISAATGAVTITNNNPTPYTNANVAAYLPTFTGNLAGGNLAVTTAITSGTITGTHLGNGAGLSNIVTSIVAGSGISINASTGAVTISAGSTTGNIVCDNLTVNSNIIAYVEQTTSGYTTSTSFTPTYSNGIVQNVTANNNFALNAPSGMVAGQSITLIITQDATGSRVMTPNAAYKFAYGVNALSTTANSIDVLSIFYNGTTYLCNLVKGYV